MPAELTLAKRVSVGNFGTCAIKMDDTVECKDYDHGNISTPFGTDVFKDIQVSAFTVCAIRMDNTVACS